MKQLLIAATLLITLSGCGGGGGNSAATSNGPGPAPTPAATYSLAGQAQKGPLIFGSRIWVSELDSSLNPNGKIYLAQTKDDLGNFVISSTIGTNLVELVGTGYYMDELTGSLSTSPVTLSAIADLSVDNTPTINILTTIQAPRMKALILQGKTYAQASAQSQTEVLAAFGVNASRITSLNALYAMQINGTTDQDSALLALSAILSKMSTTAATTNGSSQAAEMTYLLSRIASDIQNSGVLTTTSIITARNTAAIQLDLTAIRTNVETYYANRGLTMTAPKFEEWVDNDGSGILPKRRNAQPSSLNFVDLTNQEALQRVTTNEISLVGLGTNGYLTVSNDVTIFKNGSAQSLLFTTVQDGDAIKLGVTSPKLSSSASYTADIGGLTKTWNVSTRTPTFMYTYRYTWQNTDTVGGNNTNSLEPLPSNVSYRAFPFRPATSFNAKYLGMGIGGGNPTQLAIYSSTNGTWATPGTTPPSGQMPATMLANTNNFGTYFDGTFSDNLGSTYVRHPGTISTVPGFQAYLGSTGVSLVANNIYWIVLTYSGGQNLRLCSDDASYGNGPNGYAYVLQSTNGTDWDVYSQVRGGVCNTFLSN